MTQASNDNPPEQEIWGCVADSSDVYQLNFPSRAEALEGLKGQSGALVRCRGGFPRDGLEYHFDVEQLIGRVEDHAEHDGNVIANFELGLLDPTPAQEDDLRRRLADALHRWMESVRTPCWTIVEREDIEVPTNAQNPVP